VKIVVKCLKCGYVFEIDVCLECGENIFTCPSCRTLLSYNPVTKKLRILH